MPLQDPVARDPGEGRLELEVQRPRHLRGKATARRSNGCKQVGTVNVHAVLPTDEGSDYDALTAVKLTDLTGEHHSVKLTSPTGGQTTYSGNLSVGLKSSFNVGDFTVLRLRSGQRNYSLVCDPRFPTPSTSNTQAAFYYGCQPPYDRNPLTPNTYWWSNYDPTDAEPECPGYAGWFSGTGHRPARRTRTAHGCASTPIRATTASR